MPTFLLLATPSCCLPRKRAQRLCAKFGIRAVSNSKPGPHLDFNNPLLEKVRSYIQHTAREKGCHPRLIGNFDQVWSTIYRPQQKTLQKAASWRNIAKDPLCRSTYLRKVRHQIERSLELPLSETDPTRGPVKDTPSIPQVTGLAAASCTVSEWRQPRSLTTLSFIDGFIGRAYVTFRKGGISDAARNQANVELEKYLFIEEPQSKSHVWNEATMIRYLDFLAGELRVRRVQLGLKHCHRALIMCDQAGAHMSTTFQKLQMQWCQQHNVDTHSSLSALWGLWGAWGWVSKCR